MTLMPSVSLSTVPQGGYSRQPKLTPARCARLSNCSTLGLVRIHLQHARRDSHGLGLTWFTHTRRATLVAAHTVHVNAPLTPSSIPTAEIRVSHACKTAIQRRGVRLKQCLGWGASTHQHPKEVAGSALRRGICCAQV